MEISRWWSQSATTGTGRRRSFASRQGRRTRIRHRTNPGPAPFQGAWSCGAVSGACASLRHRLISIAPPVPLRARNSFAEFASNITFDENLNQRNEISGHCSNSVNVRLEMS